MASGYGGHDGGDIPVYTHGQCLLEDDGRQASPVLSRNGGRKPDAAGCLSEIVEETKRILIYLPEGNADVTFRAYAEYLSNVLRAQATYRTDRSAVDPSALKREARNFDLVLYGDADQSALERVLFGSSEWRVAKDAPTTILLAHRPRWPIRKILLVVRVEAAEELAVEWAGRFTRSSGAQLTILPLVPCQSLIYGYASRLQVGIESLLTPNTPTGGQLRSFLDQLRQWQVNGTLRVRQGDPLWQICWEIKSENYDLVIIGAERRSRLRRWLFGEVVGPLINRIDRPVLIAGVRRPDPLTKSQDKIAFEGSI